jgi:hypothetical protein
MREKYISVKSHPQSTYRDRVEKEGVYLTLSAGAHTTTIYVMVDKVNASGRATPHPHQAGLNFSS